jgi:hypothetical protein
MSNNSSRRDSGRDRRRDDDSKRRVNKEINVDNLFPSDENISGTRGKKLDVESLFSGTPLNKDPDITFTSDKLIKKRVKRREEQLKYYKQMLKYCHQRIDDADDNHDTDMIFTVVDTIPECKEYNPRECLEYISDKLREDDLDTAILTDTTMFITWKYLELKRADRDRINNDDTENSKTQHKDPVREKVSLERKESTDSKGSNVSNEKNHNDSQNDNSKHHEPTKEKEKEREISKKETNDKSSDEEIEMPVTKRVKEITLSRGNDNIFGNYARNSRSNYGGNGYRNNYSNGYNNGYNNYQRGAYQRNYQDNGYRSNYQRNGFRDNFKDRRNEYGSDRGDYQGGENDNRPSLLMEDDNYERV